YPYSLNLQIRGNNEWEPVLLRVPEKIRVSDKGKPYVQKIICKKLFAKKYPIKFYAPLLPSPCFGVLTDNGG
ncbi:MAG: hypothetical protein LBT46_15790, partial [Planctomycetaceae bacterium]|nr:hypothetical protein [Planctomycetaceae bacterium]